MTINFNNRLLIFVAAIGLISLIATGIPGSIFLKLTAAEEYNNIHSEYESMYQNLSMRNIYEENKIHLLNKIAELNIDTEILQDNIINTLSNISKKNNIELSNIKFSETMSVFTDNSNWSEESVEIQQENTAVCMKVTIDFEGNFNDMLSFIDEIKSSQTEISVTDISILTVDSQKVHVILNLMFYSLPINYSR